MLRRRGFVIGVFLMLGLLVLYDVMFFMKKKSGADAAAATTAPVEHDARTRPADAAPEPRRAAKTAAESVEGPTVVRVDPPSAQTDFVRDPFLLPMEERVGKSLKQIKEEAEALARQQMKKEDPEELKKLRALRVSGIFCGTAPNGVAPSKVRRLALVEGELVGEGAVLSGIGATVVRITATEVELQVGEIHHVVAISPLSPLGLEVK
jgi:hypothetical protein